MTTTLEETTIEAPAETSFADFIRTRREQRNVTDRRFSQRQLALRIGIQPAYLGRLEHGLDVSLSEEKAVALARELDVDPDVLLAMCGKVSKELQAIIMARPRLFGELIRSFKDLPDNAVLRLVREVRDGDW